MHLVAGPLLRRDPQQHIQTRADSVRKYYKRDNRLSLGVRWARRARARRSKQIKLGYINIGVQRERMSERAYADECGCERIFENDETFVRGIFFMFSSFLFFFFLGAAINFQRANVPLQKCFCTHV